MDAFWMWLAWRLPKPLVKWATVRLGAHATTGAYGHEVVPELRFMEALRRWEHHQGTNAEGDAAATATIHQRLRCGALLAKRGAGPGELPYVRCERMRGHAGPHTIGEKNKWA